MKQKIYLFLLLVWIGSFLPESQLLETYAATDTMQEKISLIEEEIQKNMNIHDIPGMAFALVDKNGTIFANGFGILDVRDDSSKIDEYTNFQLGSLSKVFTSLAIMQLQEKGDINIEKPVVEYLPWFSIKDSFLSNQITIKHLLNHSSGLPGRLNVHDVDTIDRQEIIRAVKQKLNGVILVGKPGEVYEYTNMNTDLLQLVIEEVTGESFENYMNEQIFKPLEMNRTGYFTYQDRQLNNTATGHRYHWGDLRPYKEELVYATSNSAGLSSNVRDLANFMIMLLNDGKQDTKSLASANSIAEMFQPNDWGIGYNWYIYPHNVYMEGGLPSFTSTMVLAADQSFGFVLLSNSKQNITLHTGFNLFKILNEQTPTTLAVSDFPKIDYDAKIILTIVIMIGIVLVWTVTLLVYQLIKGSKRIAFSRPGGKKSIFLLLILSLFLGIMTYIYVILPYYIGVPTLYDFKKEPDFIMGILLFTIIYSVYSLCLCFRILFVRNVINDHVV
ncbi:serine hydrolase domain-containing protein [Bacillus salitolerans]|uniref:Serine hydrolase domain-containing protein n=1 Tax=Bacillus salitolerans TaxID=1437434 RepID=A0ABW4LSC3_9BACI